MSGARTLGGRYVLHDEIGTGGMATVYFATLTAAVGFRRAVAIKRLHAAFAREPDNVSMFVDEARLAARIHHPNVVQTLDVIVDQGELFVVMEYVHGESLARLARGAGRVPPAIAAAIVAGVLHGLHAAHEATDERGRPLGLVHRDVSPQNVIVGADGVARVLDFGVAKAAGRSQPQTRQGQLKGKLAYMAPEQLRGEATRQTDIFAAGIVLWELMSGARLFPDAKADDALARVLDASIEATGADAALDAIALRALARDPAGRFATAREMAVAIEASVSCATSVGVAEWVAATARAALEERSRRLAVVEGRTAVTDVGAAPAAAPRAAHEATVVTRRGRPAWLTGAIAAAVVLGVGVVAWGATRWVSSRAPETQRAAPPPSSTPSAAPQPEDTGAVMAPASMTPQTPPSPARPPPATRARCDPPFTIDRSGHKHYKPECF